GSRKFLRTELEQNGIETRPLFGCIPARQPAYSHLKKIYTDELPNADFAGLNAFYIGCHQYLDEEDIGYIAKTFKNILID
ncbi:MAG: DegT/DnrJ/EryC1/StrS family aminotransferase, partial [Gammaproteobacteria bacterium]|nr:DegT/DnrJ/EryC1/StrS family aminotransferase [Gammaproteobacteria bacterium]